MKGEYTEDQDENQQHQQHSQSHHQLHNLNSMFPNFPPPHNHNHNHNHNHHSKFQPLPLPPPPHFSRSEDSDSAASLPPPTSPPPPSNKKTKHVSAEDGGTVEVSRRPRGRPPGSKNKPKPPVVITRENEPPMSPYILEVPGGTDIVDSLTRFTRRRGLGICVLTASGTVTNVTLKQPSTAAPAGTVTFHGRFDILSLSAVLLNAASFNGGGNGFAFTISLAGPQGQIVGGKVVGPLLSSGTVYVIAASFSSPSYHRLPSDDQEVAVQNQATGSAGDGQSGSPTSAGEGGSSGGGGGGPVGMYSCHLGTATSDVIWAPTARPPPPY